jgi:hypothetical protein
MSKYKENRNRVREIYGISPKDRSVNTHHILFKSEGGSDDKSNLYPMKVEDHEALHRRIQQLEEGIRNESKSRAHKRPKRVKKRRKGSRRRF